MAAALVSSRTISTRVTVDTLGGTSLVAPAGPQPGAERITAELEEQLTISLGPLRAQELLRGPFGPVIKEMYRASGALDFVRMERITKEISDIEADLTLPLNEISLDGGRLKLPDN
jgi:hypothetical protein